METKILKVVRQGEAFSVQSSKQESGTIQKCNIVLKELGGKFENEYVCAMLGNLAACRFNEGDLVVATMRFSTHEYQGQVFQEILATDINRLSPRPSLGGRGVIRPSINNPHIIIIN